MTPRESLKAALMPNEYEPIAARLEAAPASVVIGAWLPRISAVLVALKDGGDLVGWLASSVADKAEAEAAARGIADHLAANFEAAHDARQAARLLLERLAR